MPIIKSIRDVFARVIQKKSSNDNTSLRFKIGNDQKARALNPPTDNTVVENLHGYSVSDPFRPLENLDAPETATWLAQQNQKFTDYISDKQDTIQKTSGFLKDAWDYPRSSLPSRYGNKYFSSFQDGLAPQSVYQVRDSLDGAPRTLIDPNTLSADGTAALSGVFPSADGKRVAYLVSEAGSDAQTLRIRDVETGLDLPDVIKNCRFCGVLWDKDSHDSFQYTYPAEGEGRRFKIMHHVIGTAASEDSFIFERPEANSFIGPSRLDSAKYEWVSISIGTDNNNGLAYRPFGSNEPFKTLLEPLQYELSPVAEFDNGDILAATTKDAPRGRLVRFNLNDPAPEKWQTVIPEHAQDPAGFMSHQGKLFAFYSHDTAGAVKVFDENGIHLHDMPLPVQSVASYARINEEDTSFLMKISSFTSPGDTYSYDIATNKLTFVKKSDAKFDLDGCIVERIHAVSKDGTKVPMTVIRRPDIALDGTAATKLYGYGGFNQPLGPGFGVTIMDWVKSGGIYVQSNLRGGGEYGQEWYDQGRLKNKQNVFDDFIACAEHLVTNNYTSKQRLVIEGGSNGGLLTSACMVQRPDLFGAVLSAVPVTDLFRFQLGTYGAAWISDYGDPAVKGDFEVSRLYSPLHNVKDGVKYPPHLIKTADHDDRVLPWHAFKLAATLQARAHPDTVSLLRVETKAGHGAGKPTQKIIDEYAETVAFIEKAIGPVSQVDYKAKLAAEQKETQREKAIGRIFRSFK